MQRRGRYAPTPSGKLHLGNAKTALLAWLQMRNAGGTFILRMEDIDKPRCRPEYAQQIMDDLRFLGIDWDEGPDLGGPCSPYSQSAREHLYESAILQLQQKGLIYPCFCTRSQLQAIASAPHGLSSEGPVYPGTCRYRQPYSPESDKPFSYRFALPDEPLSYDDLIHGPMRYEAGAGGDFIVKRSDGLYGYQLAVVVDDAAMGITDVLRGDDLLDSTPRQIHLFRSLGFAAPAYAHAPLILGPDGKRLSKWHGSIAICELRQSGIPAERIIGFLAYWSGLTDRPEPLAAKDLIAEFRLSAVTTAPNTVSEPILQSLYH